MARGSLRALSFRLLPPGPAAAACPAALLWPAPTQRPPLSLAPGRNAWLRRVS